LEGVLRPKDITQKVRAFVLSEDLAGTYIADVEDDDLGVAMARVAAIAQELATFWRKISGLTGLFS
jgi:hypothetical protein